MICRKCKREEGIEITEIARVVPTLVIKYSNPQSRFVSARMHIELFSQQPEQLVLFQCRESGHTEVTRNDIDGTIIWPSTFSDAVKV